MAEVRQFVLDLKNFGKNIPKVVSALQRRAALRIMTDLVKGSPVDTGRFRGSWFVGIGTPDRSVLSEKMSGKKAPAGETFKQGLRRQAKNARLTGAESMARLALLTPETVKGDQDIIISNNLPYAERLAKGWSYQAPRGWVKAAVARAARELNVVKVKEPK